MRSQQQDRDGTRSLTGTINGASGGLKRGTGFAVTRTGTGVYAIRVPGMRALLTATVSPAQAADFVYSIIQQPDTITAGVYSTAQAPVDHDMDITITGLPR